MRSGEGRSLMCNSMPGTYQWRNNDSVIGSDISGINSDSVFTNTLIITSMSKLLVGRYTCRLNDEVLNTFDIRIVGRCLYNIFRIIVTFLHCSLQS